VGEAGCIRLVSYNVHRCVGSDRLCDPGRVASVLREIDADVIALQELDASHWFADGVDQLSVLAEETGFAAVPGITLQSERGHYGNGVLTRLPLLSISQHDLSVPGLEPRGAIELTLDAHGKPLGIINTHLGLRRRERRAQLRALARIIEKADVERVVLLGDLNEWVPGALKLLGGALTATRRLPTFPARRPVLALDRVLARPASCVGSTRVHRSATAMVASDHLPIVASITL
jgi:endonuclease/exonuclease/phosphatase family metal-dependent hydrolase